MIALAESTGAGAGGWSLAGITEITVVGGERYRVQGSAEEVEAMILDAARGSLMSLAWAVEAETGQRVGLNPSHIVMLRAVLS